jgi:hypothetical protein
MDTLSLDTFLVALYTITDDVYKAAYPQIPPKPGAKPVMGNSEIITLGLCAQWLKWSERKLIQYVKDYWRAYFPHLVSQSAYNKRFRSLASCLTNLVPQVGSELAVYLVNREMANYEVLDFVPVPLMKRCRGAKAKLFSRQIANIGKGGSDQEWYYGIRLGISVNPQGPVTGFILAPAKTSERWPAEYFLHYRNRCQGRLARLEDLPPSHGKPRVGPDGLIWPQAGTGWSNPQMYITDRGFNGIWWMEHWESEYHTLVLNPDSYNGEDACELRRLHSSYRQVVETVNEHLSDDLGLNRIGARSIPGLLARIAAKLLAFDIGVWLNQLFGRPTFALATLFSL